MIWYIGMKSPTMKKKRKRNPNQWTKVIKTCISAIEDNIFFLFIHTVCVCVYRVGRGIVSTAKCKKFKDADILNVRQFLFRWTHKSLPCMFSIASNVIYIIYWVKWSSVWCTRRPRQLTVIVVFFFLLLYFVD